ncbi:MAG TPA: DUF3592 domain-containing protein [Thermoanaerobaculia bacterium]|jgi:hypothetical protein|nr:DUF3592 domain-containing protein [Thermoanaerobaculia bacterium]
MAYRVLSPRSATNPANGCMVLFALLFILVGSAGAYVTLVKPAGQLVAARSWTETRCTVRSSQVALAPGRGATYRVDIRYGYAVNGLPHEAKRYDFIAGSSSGREAKQAIVDRYPPGALVPCWFDPAHPDEAVLSRSFSPAYLLGLFPLVFLAAGLGVLALAIRPGRLGNRPVAPLTAAARARSAELKAESSPFRLFLGVVFLACLWNGLTSVFVWQLATAWKKGQANGCMALFMIPFVLIGLAMILGVVRQLLALFNPRPHVTLTPGVLTPGKPALLQWRLGSGGQGVGRIRIDFEGRTAIVTPRSGRVQGPVFLTLPVVESSDPAAIAAGGTASFTVPADLSGSFQGDPDDAVWTLRIRCELRFWPDSEDEFEVRVDGGG